MKIQNNIKKIYEDKNIPLEAKAIYSYFCSICDEENNIYSSKQSILDTLMMGQDRYYKYLKVLKEHGYIKSEQIKRNSMYSGIVITIIENPIITLNTYENQNNYGYVYVVSDNNGNYKIGLSKTISKRLVTYTNMPYTPEFVCVLECSDMYLIEDYLHAKFKAKRNKGEWFNLNESDINDIKQCLFEQDIKSKIISIMDKIAV